MPSGRERIDFGWMSLESGAKLLESQGPGKEGFDGPVQEVFRQHEAEATAPVASASKGRLIMLELLDSWADTSEGK